MNKATAALVLLFTVGCAEEAPAEKDYGPPVTCPTPRAGAGHWEYLPAHEGVPQIWYTAVWTGERVLLWGGRLQKYTPCAPVCGVGAAFDPATREWEPLPTENGPGVRENAASVWTGDRWMVWGGYRYEGAGKDAPRVTLSDGASYDPVTETWEQIETVGAPQNLNNPQAIWTGTKLLVWGFALPPGGGECEKVGGLYDPKTASWTDMNMEGAPASCSQPLVWTGREAIGWGIGSADNGTGGRFDPKANQWAPISLEGTPIPRGNHQAFWTGREMLVIGGNVPEDHAPAVTSGGLYNPATDTWRLMTRENVPNQTMNVWSGSELFTWGSGCSAGASYSPKADSWSAMAVTPSSIFPRDTTLIWAGNALLAWGGWDHITWYADGAIYYPD